MSDFLGTSEYPLPDCPVCHEPTDVDELGHNGGVCNHCLESYE